MPFDITELMVVPNGALALPVAYTTKWNTLPLEQLSNALSANDFVSPGDCWGRLHADDAVYPQQMGDNAVIRHM